MIPPRLLVVFCLALLASLAGLANVDAKQKKSDAKKAPPRPKEADFYGMVVRVEGSGNTRHIIIKHANGTGLGFDVDGKTKIEGQGVSSMKGLKKGQIVKV